MPEITDAQLAELQQAHNLLKSLYADSGSGLEFKKLVKKVFPKASIPELDVLAQTEELGTTITKKTDETLNSVTKKIDDFLAERKKEKEDAAVENFETSLNKLVEDRGYTKEGREKLLTIMKEEGIQKPETAAIIFESRLPKGAPKPRSFSTRMNFVSPSDKEDEAYKRLMEDPEQFAADEMLTTINKLNSGEAEQE